MAMLNRERVIMPMMEEDPVAMINRERVIMPTVEKDPMAMINRERVIMPKVEIDPTAMINRERVIDDEDEEQEVSFLLLGRASRHTQSLTSEDSDSSSNDEEKTKWNGNENENIMAHHDVDDSDEDEAQTHDGGVEEISLHFDPETGYKINDAQNGLAALSNHQNGHGAEIITRFKPLHNGMKVSEDIIIQVEKSELEFKELDVETVLQKQNTHDLFCPNCNSCITRRVILRKRKRHVEYTKQTAKRDKFETTATIGLNSNCENSIHTENHDMIRNESDREPEEVFRCLSCLSFFVPSGNCFKLFRFFGDKNDKEEMPTPHQSATKSNWFFSIFTSDKGDEVKTIEQLNYPLLTNDIESHMDTPKHVSGVKPEQHEITINSSTRDFQVTLSETTIQLGNGETVTGVTTSTESSTTVKTTGTYLDQSSITVKTTGTYLDQSSITVKTTGTYLEERSDDVEEANTTVEAQKLQNGTLTAVTALAEDAIMKHPWQGDDFIPLANGEPVKTRSFQVAPKLIGSHNTEALLESGIQVNESEHGVEEGGVHEWDILKSIVYGGLTESITSLGVVTSAVGSGATTLNVVALGLANLIGGLFVIGHNLRELQKDRSERTLSQTGEQATDRYYELLGRREKYILHVVVVILSYIIFGLVPPIVYGFSFCKSGDSDYKLATVSVVSIICITLLALGKGHVRRPKSYIKTLLQYVVMAIMASGISYLVGILIERLLDKLGWFDSSSSAIQDLKPEWSSY